MKVQNKAVTELSSALKQLESSQTIRFDFVLPSVGVKHQFLSIL